MLMKLLIRSIGLIIWELDFYRENDDYNRYLNGFGIIKPDVNGKMHVVCEINIEKDSLNKTTAGAFAKDPQGNIYIIHRGNIANVNRTEFFEQYTGKTTQIQDGDKITPAVVLGDLNDLKLAENVRDFVFEVAKIKGVGPVIPEFKTFTEFLICEGFYFEPETIENFLLSLKTKPFVILTGNSGTGKTKIIQLFSEYLAIKNGECHKIVPVGANWTENRHIVGFYNVITKEYMKSATL